MSIIAWERRDVSDRGPSLYYVSKFLEFFLSTLPYVSINSIERQKRITIFSDLTHPVSLLT